MRLKGKLLSVLVGLTLAVGLAPLPYLAVAEDNPVLEGFELIAGRGVLADSEEGARPELIESGLESDAAELGEPPVATGSEASDAEDSSTDDDAPEAEDSAEGDAEADELILEEQAISYSQPAMRSREDIKAFLSSHPFSLTASTVYDVDPVTSPPYATGSVAETSVQQGLNALNTMRYIAGVGYTVTNNTSYASYAQASALVNAANGSISHYPSQPSGMDSSLYQRGYTGAGSSNLAYGCVSPATAILLYTDDLGNNNLGVAGHRRWILSSRLGQVGIGQVKGFNSTYVSDSSNSSNVTDVAWPARMMPTSFFSTSAQWSFSTVTQNIGTPSSIRVRVVRRRDGKVWNLSSSNITVNEVSEYGSFIGYDKNGAIVWSMEGVGAYRDGDVFDVTIAGDRSSRSYSVEFFDLYPVDDIEIYRYYFSGAGTKLSDGQEVNLIQGTGAHEIVFIPTFSESSYPQDEALQSIADASLNKISVTYTSSDESVATVKPDGEHDAYYLINGRRLWIDWVAHVTPVGLGSTTITAELSNGKSYSLTINVRKKSINPDVDENVEIYVANRTMTYTGSARHPQINVLYKNSYLSQGTDYEVTYKNDVDAGTGTATITGAGEYEGTYDVTFTIEPASLTSAVVSSIANQTYTGAAIKPSPTVTWNGRTLKAGTDYDLSYANNTNVGSATITITGKKNFKDAKTATFKIVAASLSGATVTIPDQAYTGSALTPTPTVRIGSKTLKKGTDYTVAYTSNTNAGLARATITGAGNYTGSVSATFTISPASIASATVTASSQTYTGSALKPAPTVALAGRTLVQGTDYTVSYANNTNVGTATITVTGKGNYAGTKDGTFAIGAAAISSATIASISDQTYTGAAIKPTLAVTIGSKTLKAGTDYTVTYSKNTNVGTATATITGKGNYTGTKSQTFKIVAASINDASIASIANQAYTGSAITPAPVLTWGGKTLKAGTDYTLAYGSNINAGTATITITGKGNFSGSVKVTFTITPADLRQGALIVMEDQLSYTGSALKPIPTVTMGAKTLVNGTDFTLSYKSNTNVGTATVTITGKGNYTGSVSTTFKIAALNMSWVSVGSIANQTYTGSALTPKPTVMYGKKAFVEGTDYTLSYANNVNAGTATVTVTGKGNLRGSVKKTFVINKAQVTAPAAKTGLVYNGTTQRGVATGAGYALTGTATAKKAGSFTATATLNDMANYQWSDGTTDAKTITWSIAKAKLSDASVSEIDEQTYTGEPLIPAPTLTLGSYTLKASTDYTLTYANNLDAGTATVTIKGKGSVTGTRTESFTIVWPNPFVDVSDATSHKDDILWLAAKNISAGWTEPDGTKTFRPNDDVKRGDMAAFLFRLAKLWGVADDSWKPTNEKAFVDVTGKTSHRDEILWLAEQGISTGWEVKGKPGEKEFRPNEPVKRGEMAAFMYRLATKAAGRMGQEQSPEDFFVDVTRATSFHDEIWWLAGNGVTEGWEVDGVREFRPNATVKRGDMAAFLHRLDGVN